MKYCVAMLFVCGLTPIAMGTLVVYEADLSQELIQNNNTSSPAPTNGSLSGSNWTASWVNPNQDSSGNFLGTTGGVFATRDWGGEASFLSSPIDVSSLPFVDVSLLGAMIANNGLNIGSEFFTAFYELDDVRTDIFSVNGEPDFSGSIDATALNIDTSSASILEIGFDFNIDGGGDGFDVTSFTVATIPEPTAALLGGLIAGALGLTVARRPLNRD